MKKKRRLSLESVCKCPAMLSSWKAFHNCYGTNGISFHVWHNDVQRMWHFFRSKNLPYSMEEVRRIASVKFLLKSNLALCSEGHYTFIHATSPFQRISIDFNGLLPSSSSSIATCWQLSMRRPIRDSRLCISVATFRRRPLFVAWHTLMRLRERLCSLSCKILAHVRYFSWSRWRNTPFRDLKQEHQNPNVFRKLRSFVACFTHFSLIIQKPLHQALLYRLRIIITDQSNQKDNHRPSLCHFKCPTKKCKNILL